MKKWTAVTLADAQRNPAGVGSEPIGIYEHHTTTLTTRVKTGEAEQHRDWADMFVVVNGSGSLVSGGHLVKSRVIREGEERGDSVEGGSSVVVETGSLIHIDPGVPHQLVLTGDAPFTYFVVKVKTAPASHRMGNKP
jgi:mannose-6-phosphate isomerase-like protein (cupin superfamily)